MLRRYEIGSLEGEDIIEHKCPSGAVLRYVRVQGRYMYLDFNFSGFVPDPRSHYPALKNMEVFDDDILICAYPKSGTHWVWEMVTMLTRGKAVYDPRPKESVMIEFNPIQQLEREPRPRVLNTHLFSDTIPQSFLEEKGKIIFIQRNPKDVLVSWYNQMKNTKVLRDSEILDWIDIVHLAINYGGYGSDWFAYTREWEEEIKKIEKSVLLLFFENILQDPVKTVNEIADFLGIECSTEMAKQISDQCSFENMKKANKGKCDPSHHNCPNPELTDPDKMFRKGIAGDWKKWFTVKQSQEFDEAYRKRMKGSAFSYVYERHDIN